MDSAPDTIPTFDLGDRLRKAREHAGIGSQQMADHLLVSRNTITRYENMSTRLTAIKLRRWAELTGVPLDWLVGEGAAAGQHEQGSTWVRMLCATPDLILSAA